MTSSVPGYISWSIISLSIVTLVARSLLTGRTADTERLVTYALGFGILAAVFRERAVQNFLADQIGLSVGFTRQFGTTMIVMAFVPFVLLAAAWSRSHVTGRRTTEKSVWIVGYLSVPLMLLLGTHARSVEQYIDRTQGWQTVAYFTVFAVWCGAVGTLVAYVSVRELTRGKLRPKHTATYLIMLFIGAWTTEEAVSIFASSVFAATGTGGAFVDFRFAANENNFVFILLLGAIIAAIRPLAVILEVLGIDRVTRSIRRLQPLRDDLVEACRDAIPDLDQKYHLAAGSGRLEALQRMTVEIRDCLLVLGRFAAPAPNHRDPSSASAIQIAAALNRKLVGDSYGEYIRLHATDTDRDLMEEVRALQKIARRWQSAQQTAAVAHAK
ncbi:DUF6545 domain-containing protein [Rhodococcoides yunnanense]|uniref:DUF6545 domain-containing protein n=1 Tax=Rhodococcoides yunnanense TaxID=278209 RepID=UPI0022B10345|nr:DUF6545 domain-containing protein [Rhodococcus yunnanensis]MCZ4277390.1 hypothetical protein [Rhodococcus yunnanensis]